MSKHRRAEQERARQRFSWPASSHRSSTPPDPELGATRRHPEQATGCRRPRSALAIHPFSLPARLFFEFSCRLIPARAIRNPRRHFPRFCRTSRASSQPSPVVHIARSRGRRDQAPVGAPLPFVLAHSRRRRVRGNKVNTTHTAPQLCYFLTSSSTLSSTFLISARPSFGRPACESVR